MKNILHTLPEKHWIYNPWWENASAVKKDAKLLELENLPFVYCHPLLESFPLDQDAILTLRGPRQIGKSTLVKQIIRKLLEEKGVGGPRVFFYSCDTVKDFRELEEVLKIYLDQARAISSKRLFIFLDEISFVFEWQRAVKALADRGELKNATLLLTGSSSVDLLHSGERLPGRRGKLANPDILFLPLSFAEVYKLLGGTREKKRKLFDDYLVCGGFPLVINEYYSKGYITDNTFNTYLSWLEGDLHKLGKSEELALRIIERLFKHLSSNFSYYRIAKESGIGSHATVIEYMEILEKMFVVFGLKSFLVSQKTADPAKNRKAYFCDPFIFNVLKARVEGLASQYYPFVASYVVTAKSKPVLVENAVAVKLSKTEGLLYTGRLSKGEVDFVLKSGGRYRYIEVKYREAVLAGDFSNFFKEVPYAILEVVSKKDTFRKQNVTAVVVEDFLLS
ncbi:MAG: ATP-binding protein [bacterium]